MNKKQCIVIGLGRFGESVATNLSALGNEVLAIDIKEDNVRHISDRVSHAIQADITDEDTFKSLEIYDFDIAVVGIGANVESSCLAIISLKQKGVKNIIVKAKNETCGKILEAVGATKVIYPERDMGARVAHSILSPNILDFIEFSKEYSIAEVSVPTWAINKTIEELNVRKQHHVNIIAVKKNHSIQADVTKDTILQKDDILYLIGKDEFVFAFK